MEYDSSHRPVIKGIDKCSGTMEVKGIPPSTVWSDNKGEHVP